MLIRNSAGEYKLDIFDRFFVDPSLPKFNLPSDESILVNQESILNADGNSRFVMTRTLTSTVTEPRNVVFVNDSNVQTNQGWQLTGTGQSMNPNTDTSRKGWFHSTWERIKAWLFPPQKPMPVIVVFEAIAKDAQEIKTVEMKIKGYTSMIEKAKSMGQTALAEKLEKDVFQKSCEAVLEVAGFCRFVTEEQLVSWVKKCERGLRLDWMKNFIRIIPDAVQAKKTEADKLHLFDNYVILHYDPENKFNQWTEEEKKAEREKRRDPILFGVIRGINVLYLIADWKDDLCD